MRDEKMNLTYREMDRKLAELHARIHESGEKDKAPYLATDEANAEVEKEWESLKNQVEALPAPDGVYALLKHHFQDFLDSLHFAILDAKNYPEGPFLSAHYGLASVGRGNNGPAEERLAAAASGLRWMQQREAEYLNLIKARHPQSEWGGLSQSFAREKVMLESEGKHIDEYYSDFSEEQKKELADTVQAQLELLDRMAKALEQEKPKADRMADDLSRTVKMDVEEYRALLRDKLGVSLDELLAWHKEEIEKTRSECLKIANELDLEEPVKDMLDVRDILFRLEPPCESAEEMFERANQYLKRTRALAHEYVKLPDHEQCRCVPLPDCYKDSYPWGGYEGGDFRKVPYHGQMFLNQYNYQNITDGWIKLNSLHEAYPGHHVQYVRAAMDPTPETVKIGTKLIPILEGTCLRTERAFQFIFAEDPVFALFVAYRRHHASVRILVDLMMFYYGAALEDVVAVYEKELGFDRVTARAQVQAHQNTPGYFTCYYYGMKKITQWEQELGFNKWDYTEMLFSAGYISIESLQMLLNLSAEDRERYFHDFPSLLREEKA